MRQVVPDAPGRPGVQGTCGGNQEIWPGTAPFVSRADAYDEPGPDAERTTRRRGLVRTRGSGLLGNEAVVAASYSLTRGRLSPTSAGDAYALGSSMASLSNRTSTTFAS